MGDQTASAPGTTHLEGRPPRRFSREWWAPLLVALGLLIILLIGFLTALTADRRTAGQRDGADLFRSVPAATIMIASNAPPGGALEGKVRQWRT
jgi:hypothetical protein